MIEPKDLQLSHIAHEHISPALEILHAVVRDDGDDRWYECELKNISEQRIWGIKAQLKFFDQAGTFLGFEEDEHEPYLEPGRTLALSIYAIPPAGSSEARMTLDATVEEPESGLSDTWLAIGLMLLLLAGMFVYNRFF